MFQLHILLRTSTTVTRDAVELVTVRQGCSEIHWFLMSHIWQAFFSLIGAPGTWLMSHSLICAVSITALTETAGLFFACALGTHTVCIRWHFICQNCLDDLSSVDKTFWDGQSCASALTIDSFISIVHKKKRKKINFLHHLLTLISYQMSSSLVWAMQWKCYQVSKSTIKA